MRRIVAAFCFAGATLGVPALLAGAEQVAPPWTWNVIQHDGVHWLQDVQGERLFSKGVNSVHGGENSEKSRNGQAYYWGNTFSSLKEWRKATRERLLHWGFNTLGGWSDASSEIALPLTIELDLGRNASLLWSDPFQPGMAEKVYAKAEELTAPYRDDPRLMGYFTDNEVGWWNSPVFRWYLKADWTNHTKRGLWQLLYETYDGNWERLLKDFVPQGSLSGFDELRGADVELKLRPGGEGIQLVNRFLGMIAGHYYRLVGSAVRKAHPGALVLGDRLPLYYNQDALLSIGNSVDVISSNYNLDTRNGWVAPFYFEGLARLSKHPVLVSEFFVAAEENRSGNRNERNGKPGHLMWVQSQAERADALSNALCNFANFPNIVGTHWFKYSDEPTGGREDGEDYNMGLVDIADRPYELVTEVFKARNAELAEIHASARFDKETVSSNTFFQIQRATHAIDLEDNGLRDWDLAQTRVVGFNTQAPYAPFADVHLAWAPDGLYLSTIASNYFDPQLLDYEDEFPLTDTFQIRIDIQDAADAVRTFGIHLLPVVSKRFSYEKNERFELEPRIYRYHPDGAIERMPTDGHVGQLSKPIPHISFEAFLPAEWLGQKALQSEQLLHMNISAIKYHRAQEMSLGEVDGGKGIDKSPYLAKFRLNTPGDMSAQQRDSWHLVGSCIARTGRADRRPAHAGSGAGAG